MFGRMEGREGKCVLVPLSPQKFSHEIPGGMIPDLCSKNLATTLMSYDKN